MKKRLLLFMLTAICSPVIGTWKEKEQGNIESLLANVKDKEERIKVLNEALDCTLYKKCFSEEEIGMVQQEESPVSYKERREMLKWLLEKGANPNAEINSCLLPLDCVVRIYLRTNMPSQELCDDAILLVKYGADPYSNNSSIMHAWLNNDPIIYTQYKGRDNKLQIKATFFNAMRAERENYEKKMALLKGTEKGLYFSKLPGEIAQKIKCYVLGNQYQQQSMDKK